MMSKLIYDKVFFDPEKNDEIEINHPIMKDEVIEFMHDIVPGGMRVRGYLIKVPTVKEEQK